MSHKDLIAQLRKDADEIEGWGAGNEAANVRKAAYVIARQDAMLAVSGKPVAWRIVNEDGTTECWYSNLDVAALHKVKAHWPDRELRGLYDGPVALEGQNDPS